MVKGEKESGQDDWTVLDWTGVLNNSVSQAVLVENNLNRGKIVACFGSNNRHYLLKSFQLHQCKITPNV